MSEKKYLDESGVSRLISKIKTLFAPRVHTHTKSQITDFPSAMKNPSALTFTGGVSDTYDGSSAKVVEIPTTMKGATDTSDGASGLVTTPLKGASNRYLRSDGTWSVPPDTNTTYSNATTSSAGLMSSSDKSKLDGIASGANKYVHPDYTAKTNGLYKVTVDSKGHVSETTVVSKADITALGIPAQDTTYSTGTASTAGVTKLYTSTGTNTDGTMTQKAINDALSGKAGLGHDHTIGDISGLQDSLDNKAVKEHSHAISDVTGLQGKLDSKASKEHDHDDRYYTESEMDTKLNAKSNTGHGHAASDITSGTLSADRLPAIPVDKLTGTISSENLPSYVDDVLEFNTVDDFPTAGEAGKIYVATKTNLTYRWSGTGYVEISPSLALGTTDSTAYRGDYGNIAYVHSQMTSGNPHKVTKSDVGLGNVDNTADANKSVKYATSAGVLTGNITGDWAGAVSTSKYLAVFDPDHDEKGHIRAMTVGNAQNLLGVNSKLPLSGGTVTGNVTFNDTLSSDTKSGTAASKIVIVPQVAYSTIDSTHTDSTYYKELMKWICTNYPNRTDTIFVGSANPNSANQFTVRIYNTSTVNTDGYPQYASGTATTLGGAMLTFGFSNYSYYMKQMSDTEHTHYYAVSSSIGGAATYVAGNVAGGDVLRHVWFSDSVTETARVYDDNFKYNPSTRMLTTNISGNASTANTAYSLAGFTNTTTSGTAIDSAITNGHVYVTGTSGIYSQNDGAAFVQAYSTSWAGQIYQDYRTGQIALRGKNNGTWQSWRKVLDSSNYTSYAAPASHTHSSVNDVNDGAATTFAYSKAGMGYSDYTWLAGWNGKELRAVAKSQFATAGHTHTIVVGQYTGNGGQQNPSYIGGASVKFNMMNTTINSDSNYKDFILMDTYSGSDVPYVTALGIDKAATARAFIMSGKKGGSSWDYKAELISTQNIGSQSVNYATSAGSASSASSASTATTAAKLGRSGSTSTPMTFYWYGQSGQPTWLWGGTDGTNMYVYNPSNFSVNYATSAGSASSATYINWTAGNEIRFNKPSYTSATSLWFGWAWSNGDQTKLISQYNFAGGDGKLTNVAANTFIGALSGNATTATTASKLGTNAGSSTRPVYFSGGVPVACSYTLGKSVPSNAVFTDTNTWRGIQNNLTSTSTTDSLSAYQGKLLNDKIATCVVKSGSKTLKPWQAWGFCYGDGTYMYLFFPGIFVGATGTVVKPSNGIWIRAFTGTETAVYESEWSQGLQTDQGVHLGYKHSGWTTITGFIVRSNANTTLSAS